jgi:DNA polymerase-3 subunit alpha
MSVFDIGGEDLAAEVMTNKLPDVEPFSKDINLAMEKEMLGVYITDHPLNDYADRMKEIVSVTSEELNHAGEEAEMTGASHIQDGMKAVMAGMVTSKRTLITKSNKMMAFLVLEDLYGVSEVVVLPNVYEKCASILQGDAVVAVKGTLNFKEDEAPKLLADNIVLLEDAHLLDKDSNDRGQYRQPQTQRKESQPKPAAEVKTAEGMIKLRIPSSENVNVVLEQIKFTLSRHTGNAEVLIYLPDGKILRIDSEYWAEPSAALNNQLTAILGAGNVKMQ